VRVFRGTFHGFTYALRDIPLRWFHVSRLRHGLGEILAKKIKSKYSYNHELERRIVALPSVITLHSYIGPM
jgi:hypothetical protein